ncbi:hypothetical protein L195_g039613 [Trifolium pratense]|uniref:Uncharacterized protein n=2 Tax=Trifolium pratense TaxID=57577 RepID=A0ACB0KGH2_TRIPR|nr:hypothetical protein L195_g039613 [Trifolium pratense]CAJ2656389.1 unnamed protein product [Trifolium pratense]
MASRRSTRLNDRVVAEIMFDHQNVVVRVHNPSDDNIADHVDGVLNIAQDVHNAVEGVVNAADDNHDYEANGQIIHGNAVINHKS